MTHSAHIQTALDAACKFGREQYAARTRYKDYDVSNALAALAAMPPEVRSQKPEVPVIGGGNSLTGRIKWLLENNGAMTRAELDEQLHAETPATCATLKNKGILESVGRGDEAKFSLRKAVGV